MASLSSLLHLPALVSHSSSVSSSTAVCSLPSYIDAATKAPFYASSKRHQRGSPMNEDDVRKRNVFLRSTAGEASVLDPPPAGNEEGKRDVISALKIKLLSVVSGLNRGLAASKDDVQKADAVAKELEDVGGLVDLSTDIDKLQGRWKLIYSSAFSSRTLGGSRPGPPTGRLLPLTLGQVFQRIDILGKDFDNIVEVELGVPWPLQPVGLTATLAHKFELIGSAKIKITFEKTTVRTTGNLSQLPPLEIPRLPDALRPPSNTGSGEFEVTYLDSDTRITRGDRGELRAFVLS